MGVLLTIAIPTFNGDHLIKTSLDSILRQLEPDISGSVEILISDNASTDDTSTTISRYMTEWPRTIRYERNEFNLGYDRNIDLLFRRARGRFVKILADDDALEPGALGRILKLIHEHPRASIFVSNFDVYDATMTNVIQSININNGEDMACPTADDLIKASGGRYGQVSSLMIERDLWNRINPDPAVGTQYVHVYMVLLAAMMAPSYFCAKPLIRVRTGSPNFEKNADDRIVVPMGMIRLLRILRRAGYQSKIINRLLKEQRNYVFRKIYRSKVMGMQHPFGIISLCIRYNWDYLLLWILFLPMLLMPRQLFLLVEAHRRPKS